MTVRKRAERKDPDMPRYDIEFTTAIYVNIPVEAETLEEAQAIADKAITRHSIQDVVLSDDLSEGTDVWIDSKGWELNPAEFIEDDDTDLPVFTCRHCGQRIDPDFENGWVHADDGVVGCGLLPGETSGEASQAEQRELYAEPAGD